MADKKPIEWSTPRKVVVADQAVKRDRRHGLPEPEPRHRSKKNSKYCKVLKGDHRFEVAEESPFEYYLGNVLMRQIITRKECVGCKKKDLHVSEREPVENK